MWFDGFNQGKVRMQQRMVIPAWAKGDRVLHKPSGIYGVLVEMQTKGGELWKLQVESSPFGEAVQRGRRYCMQVHASDLELRV